MRLGEISWDSVFNQTFYKEGIGWGADAIYIPTTLNTPIVRIHCSSSTARSSWRAAGQIVQIIGDFRDPDFEGQAIDIPLNVIKLLEFSPTVEAYSFKFLPKPWIDSFELKIESPSGG